jgi:phage recombination protein Bet
VSALEPVQPMVTPDRYQLLKDTVAQGLSDTEFELFVAVANKRELSPFDHQIWAIKRGGRLVIQVGIDGLRLIAERSKYYDGQDQVEWCDDEGTWRDVWLQRTHPAAARTAVYKRTGPIRSRYPATVTWEEFAPDINKAEGFMWKQMPSFMLGKVAEAHALRKAFPADLSGLYEPSEMDRTNNETSRRTALAEGGSNSTEKPAHGLAPSDQALGNELHTVRRDEPAVAPERIAHLKLQVAALSLADQDSLRAICKSLKMPNIDSAAFTLRDAALLHRLVAELRVDEDDEPGNDPNWPDVSRPPGDDDVTRPFGDE